jgi:hypothetical protein
MSGLDSGAKAATDCQAAEIERHDLERGVGHRRQDGGPGSLGLVEIPGADDDVGAVRRELPRRLEPQPAVATGDDGNLARQIRDIARLPAHRDSYPSVSPSRPGLAETGFEAPDNRVDRGLELGIVVG